jgi:hypothetical protein
MKQNRKINMEISEDKYQEAIVEIWTEIHRTKATASVMEIPLLSFCNACLLIVKSDNRVLGSFKMTLE